MTRTVHVTNAYHASSGGIRTFYRALVDEANRRGRPLSLIVPAARHGVEDVGGHARIHYVRAPRSPWIDSRYRVLLPSQFLLPGRRLARILREERPDLVEVCDKYSLCHLAGVIRRGWVPGLRRPVLVGLTCERMDDNVEQHLGLGPAGRRWAARYMRRVYLPQFDAHIAISQYTAGELRPQPPRHRRRVDVLPLGSTPAASGRRGAPPPSAGPCWPAFPAARAPVSSSTRGGCRARRTSGCWCRRSGGWPPPTTNTTTGSSWPGTARSARRSSPRRSAARRDGRIRWGTWGPMNWPTWWPTSTSSRTRTRASRSASAPWRRWRRGPPSWRPTPADC